MHQNSLANLHKWPKGTSGDPAGRKLGSKNIATIVKELLEQDIDTRFPLNDRLKQLIADYPQMPSSRKILSYRCDNQYCQRKVKELKLSQSVRAITIFNFMYEMLHGLDVNREDYEKLRKRLETRNKAKLQELRIKVHSLQVTVKSIDRDVNERSLQILSLNKTSHVYKNNERYIEEQTVKMQGLQGEIEKLQEQITNPSERHNEL